MEAISTPQCWKDFEDIIKAGIDRVILYGAPGTGKTYAGLTHNVVEDNSYRLVCSEEMTTADISGSFMPNANGGFTFLEGSALKAWRNGGRLVVDEGDKASGDVLGTLLNFTDTVGSSSFTHPETDEIITPQEGFSVVITSNIEHPDDLPVALRDRFPLAIEINAPHPKALERLPENLRLIASACVSAEPSRRASLRMFYAYDQLARSVGDERAAVLTFGKQRAEAIIDAIKVGSL
jgi:MoxR-like ATPase